MLESMRLVVTNDTCALWTRIFKDNLQIKVTLFLQHVYSTRVEKIVANCDIS